MEGLVLTPEGYPCFVGSGSVANHDMGCFQASFYFYCPQIFDTLSARCIFSGRYYGWQLIIKSLIL
jgi:hypothetical protein